MRGGSVAKVNKAVVEAPLVEQLEVHADAVREVPVAAADDDRREEEVALVDQPGREAPAPRGWARRPEVARGRRLQLPDRLGVEVALDPRPARWTPSSVVE